MNVTTVAACSTSVFRQTFASAKAATSEYHRLRRTPTVRWVVLRDRRTGETWSYRRPS